MSAFTRPARAKLNLYLHVTNRRADGYHELDSLVAFADVSDTLTFEPADSLDVSFDGPSAPAIDNLSDTSVHKAARWLADHLDRPATAHISVTKVLPVAAGVGGGSADCAAALEGLADLWGEDVDWTPLSKDIAFALGADVPVCLAGHPVHMSGIGEQITPAPKLPASWVVLANAGAPVSTAAVYGGLDRRFHEPHPFDPSTTFRTTQDLADALKERTNSLAPPAMETAPIIQSVLAALEQTSGCLMTRVSGSGGTCFGLYASADAARAAASGLSTAYPDWWIADGALV